jgi:predicted alpha/beta hydrolase
MTEMDTREPTSFTVASADGYGLSARRYAPTNEAAQGRIVMAGGTGVPQGFYRRFAQHAATRGFQVTTFDYRGIGGSAPRTLRNFKMDYLDWGRLDLAAVVNLVAAEDTTPLYLVGHSFGGMALGLMPDTSALRAVYTFGTGPGWAGWMSTTERIRVRFLWSVVGPTLVRTYGYLAWSRLGMGEDLPRDAYVQWRAWSRFPRFFLDDPTHPEIQESYDRVVTPIAAANSVDDPWMPPAARDALMSGYRSASVTTVDIRPSDLGIGPLGHMGYFKSEAVGLWDSALDWLALHA